MKNRKNSLDKNRSTGYNIKIFSRNFGRGMEKPARADNRLKLRRRGTFTLKSIL
jgi:hypothetical protein